MAKHPNEVCDECHGTGKVDCPLCGGDGEIECSECGSTYECRYCSGRGKVDCPVCEEEPMTKRVASSVEKTTMPKYLIYCTVECVSGHQTFAVEANSEAHAIAEFKARGGELMEEEVAVEAKGEPECLGLL